MSQQREVYWYDMLTLDHTVCRVCFVAGHRKADHPSMQLGSQTLYDRHPNVHRGSPRRTRAGYLAALRADTRLHYAAEHPEVAVRWSRSAKDKIGGS